MIPVDGLKLFMKDLLYHTVWEELASHIFRNSLNHWHMRTSGMILALLLPC